MRLPWSRKQPEQRSTVMDMLSERRAASAPESLYLTPGQSLQRVAVFASVNLIASTCSQLPVDLFRGSGPRKQELPAGPLLQDPGGEGYGFADWAWTVFQRALLQGNAVGLIAERDPQGFPTVIQLKDLNRVSARLDGQGRAEWKIDGKEVPADQVWHFRAYPQENSIMGLSPIGLHMQTVGMGAAAEQFGSRFYMEGAHPTALLVSEAPLSQEQAQVVKNRFVAAVRSSRGEPVVVPSAVKYQPIQIPPAESLFLESQKYSATETARIFGPGIPELLGYETGGSMTYANVESRSMHLLMYTLNQWLRRMESALSSPKLTPRGQFVRFKRPALLQATTLDRYRAYEIALRNKWVTVNEVRDLEDCPPVSWGDGPNETTPMLPGVLTDNTGNTGSTL